MAILKSTRLRLKNSGSVGAVREYLRTTREYYAQDEVKDGKQTILPDAEWLGSEAAQRLGLHEPGRDQDEDFAQLLAGYHPKTGKPLVQNAGEAGRCMGLDLTFSPRKEYSLAFIAASPEQRKQMTQAFHFARDKALGLVSKGVNTRGGKGGKRHVGVKGLVIRAVDHIDSRIGDPQWHCHAVVANVALDEDGKWRSVDFRDLMRTTGSLQEAAQEVFSRELAEGFLRLGFGIERERILDEDERDTGKVANKIAGIDQATCDAFSSRREEIKEEIKKAEAKGETLTGGEAAMKTRQSKHMGAAEVILAGLERLEEIADRTPGHFKRASELRLLPSVELENQKSAGQWFDELHATDSHWNRSGLIAKLARELPLGSEIDIPEEADRLLVEWEKSGKIIRLRDDPDLQQARWCSRDQWFLEVGVLPAAKTRADEQPIRLNRLAAEVAITLHEEAMSKRFGKPIQLTDEQKASVYHVLCETGGLACIIGQAGTGKSASAGAYIRAFEQAGRRVIGTSTSQAATDNLKKEAGIEGMNTAELLHALDSGKLTLSASDVIVLDEAGMVGAKTFRRIQKHVDAAGGKLVAVGDPKQLEAIEAGGPFAELCEKFGAAAITQIQRQRNAQERALAESFYNDKKTGADIVQEMRDKGMLIEDKHQIKALAKKYLEDERSLKDKLIVVNTHADGAAVDHYVRRGLKERGVIHERAVEVLTLGSGEYQRELEVCVGERIRFQKNDRKDRKTGERRWNNNDIGTVMGFKAARGKRGLTLKIKMDEDGRIVEVDTAAFHRIGYAYARTAHSAQGLGAESTYWLARGATIDRNMGLVAMTRTKNNFHAFASPEEAKRLEQALDNWGKKETVRELARRRNAREVATTLQQAPPTMLGEVEHPMSVEMREAKAQLVNETINLAEEVQRAGRAFNQAMECFKEERRVELGQAKAELVNLRADGGAISLYENPPEGADDKLMNSLARGARRARLRVAYLEERIETLKMETPEAKRQATEDITAWLEQNYIGGVQAARYDRELRRTKVRLRSFRERAQDRRQLVFARERQAAEGMAGIREAQAELEAITLGRSVKQRAENVAVLHRTIDRLQGQTKQDLQRVRRQRQVALGLDTTTPFHEIDWTLSRFPDRDVPKRPVRRQAHTPSTTPAPKLGPRPGALSTQPKSLAEPRPPWVRGRDQEIDM